MKKFRSWFEKGTTMPLMLVATAFVALAGLMGIALSPDSTTTDAIMRIQPDKKVLSVNQIFEVDVVVESSVPVNVFAGELHFNYDILKVTSIDYNVSIANLWAELPWYSNGVGTLNFGGGTTQSGGFTGNDTLIKITFETLREGEGIISLHEPRIFLHDGLGTDAKLTESKDAIFTVRSAGDVGGTDSLQSDSKTTYKVVKKIPSTDLNGDGKQSIADISIFILNIAGEDTRYDFNLDGEVNLKDLNILLGK